MATAQSTQRKLSSLLPLLLVLILAYIPTARAAQGLQAAPKFDRVIIDSLDADSWNGVVVLAKAYQQQVSFALRVGSRRSHYLVGEKIFHAVSEVGPHAPDASYCRVSWRHLPQTEQVTLEWSRVDENTVAGRLTAEPGFLLVLETYFPFSHEPADGNYAVDLARHAIIGERYFDNVFNHQARLVVMTDQPLVGSGAYRGSNDIQAAMDGPGMLAPPAPHPFLNGAAGMEFHGATSAHFVAVLGWDKEPLLSQASALLAPGKIDALLDAKARAYRTRRPSVDGMFEGASDAIGNSMFWNTLYAAKPDLVFPSISRHWAHGWGNWVVGEWDCFFGALLTSLEDEAQTSAGVRAILSSQAENGVVPNMASGRGTSPDRSQPPVGSYVVWKVFERRQDRDLLTWAYPHLVKWHDFWLGDRGDGQPWRDGNRDGLLEWGSDPGSTSSTGGRGHIAAARWESGMDDSPMWDDIIYDLHTHTMNLNDVGLNSLYALDAECLGKIAAILGKDDDRRKYAAEYDRMKQLVRDKLWNDKDGIYENRYWDGRFSSRLSPTNFYPLFAGIATQQQAERMVKEHLLNPQEFWGQYVAPTIARNDPAFPGQFYWRGDIWGPTNYMLYEGVNRYRFDQAALQFAEKSYDLYMDDWKRNQHDNEQYYAWGGSAGGDTHYTWGALLCLIPLEQYIDMNPWEGLRFGVLDPPHFGQMRRAVWGNHTYEVNFGPLQTTLYRDHQQRFQATAGVVVRDYEASPSRLAFTLNAAQPLSVLTQEFADGELSLQVDGKPAGRVHVQHGQARFPMPPGEHTVELVR